MVEILHVSLIEVDSLHRGVSQRHGFEIVHSAEDIPLDGGIRVDESLSVLSTGVQSTRVRDLPAHCGRSTHADITHRDTDGRRMEVQTRYAWRQGSSRGLRDQAHSGQHAHEAKPTEAQCNEMRYAMPNNAIKCAAMQ